MTVDIRVNGERLWGSIMEMAKIGATANGGSHRLTLSDEDKIARDLFADACADAGLTMTIDQMGDMFARRAGKDESRAPVGMGSHLDTQPYGGRFDGVFGVLAALEVIRTLNDHDITTIAPLEVVNWTNEEGARFAPSMLASGVYGGVFELDWAQSRRAVDSGATLIDELKRIGYYGAEPVIDHKFSAFFECHIEQGPILDTSKESPSVSSTQRKVSAGTTSRLRVSPRIPARHLWWAGAMPCSAWQRSFRPSTTSPANTLRWRAARLAAKSKSRPVRAISFLAWSISLSTCAIPRLTR